MANTFKNAATGSSTTLQAMYTCPSATTAVIHAMYLSNIDGTNSATVNLSVSGSANFEGRVYLLKTVNVPADCRCDEGHEARRRLKFLLF